MTMLMHGGISQTIDAPSTAYGLAFSVDGKFMYLGSAQHGTVTAHARVIVPRDQCRGRSGGAPVVTAHKVVA